MIDLRVGISQTFTSGRAGNANLEIYGLSPWIRTVADQLAADGFIAVAPDFLSGRGSGGGGTDSAASRDDVVKLVRELPPEEVAAKQHLK